MDRSSLPPWRTTGPWTGAWVFGNGPQVRRRQSCIPGACDDARRKDSGFFACLAASRRTALHPQEAPSPCPDLRSVPRGLPWSAMAVVRRESAMMARARWKRQSPDPQYRSGSLLKDRRQCVWQCCPSDAGLPAVGRRATELRVVVGVAATLARTARKSQRILRVVEPPQDFTRGQTARSLVRSAHLPHRSPGSPRSVLPSPQLDDQGSEPVRAARAPRTRILCASSMPAHGPQRGAGQPVDQAMRYASTESG